MNKLAHTSRMRTLQQSIVSMKVKRSPTPSAFSSRMLHGGSEPTFYYQGWHNHSSGGSILSYHSANHLGDKQPMVDTSESPPAGSQLRSSRVMSPETDKEQFEISWDEDYDEYNLHIAPHQVTNRCQHVHNIEAVEHNDLYDLHCDETTPAYSWDVASVGRALNAPTAAEYDDRVTNVLDEGEVAFDF